MSNHCFVEDVGYFLDVQWIVGEVVDTNPSEDKQIKQGPQGWGMYLLHDWIYKLLDTEHNWRDCKEELIVPSYKNP